jgi:hypothetical protein
MPKYCGRNNINNYSRRPTFKSFIGKANEECKDSIMELNDLYSSPNIVRVIKSRRMRWARHVARMGEERGVYRVLVGKPKGKRPLGRPGRRWVIILGRISRRWDVGMWTGLGWPRIEIGGGRL